MPGPKGSFHIGLLATVKLVLLAVVAIVVACSGDVVDRDAESGDAGVADAKGSTESDSEHDVAEPGEDTVFNQEDTSGNSEEPDVDEPDLPDPSPYENWTDCGCPHEDDMCTPHLCGRPGIFCGPGGEECPEGYQCVQYPFGNQYYCRCDGDDSECGIVCESNADCPAASMSCSHEVGICGPRMSCTINWSCPAGYYCDGSNCEVAGDSPDGASCSHAMECFSGTCHLRCDPDEPDCMGTCASQCLHDGDCIHDDEHCVISAEADQNGCQPWADCGGESCPDGQICSSSECVVSDYCVTTADCEEGDCVDLFLPETFFFSRRCKTYGSGPESYCKPEEVFYDFGTPYCQIPNDRCVDALDCEHPYECVGSACVRFVDPIDE
jgi:hypothetical protein